MAIARQTSIQHTARQSRKPMLHVGSHSRRPREQVGDSSQGTAEVPPHFGIFTLGPRPCALGFFFLQGALFR